jgi:hypothetical protein
MAREETVAEHVALLGDSIFDNGAYTGGLPDVVTHLRGLLPPGTRATLLAVDGSTTADLPGQLARLPADADRAVLSVGGNDALANLDVLSLPAASAAGALSMLGARVSRFESAYRGALDQVLQRVPQTTLCTIYGGNLPGPEWALARLGLGLFNDVILRVAFEHGLPVIDLRLVCNEAGDYANAIEPSSQGGRKIAGAIADAIGLRDGRQVSLVFA